MVDWWIGDEQKERRKEWKGEEMDSERLSWMMGVARVEEGRYEENN